MGGEYYERVEWYDPISPSTGNSLALASDCPKSAEILMN